MKDKKNSFQKINLIQLLKTFSKVEMTEFDKFVRSPFFNNRSEVTRFFQAIKQFHPAFGDENFTKEKIFAKLHPKEKYRDDVVRRMSSNLYSLGEKYLIYQKHEEFPIENKLKLMDVFTERRLDSQFDKLDKEVFEDLQKFSYRNETYYKLEIEYNINKSSNIGVVDNNRDRRKLKHEIIDSFINYAIFFLLDNYSELLENYKLYEQSLDHSFLTVLISYLDNNKSDIGPALKIYVSLVKLDMNENDEQLFENLKNNFFKYSDALQIEEQFNIVIALLNYCIRRRFEGKRKYLYEEHELFKFQIKKKLFQKNILPLNFLNIVSVACYCKQTDWASNFLKNFKNRLPAPEKQKIIDLSLAVINMSLKKYDDSLIYLAKVVPENLYYKSVIKRMTLRIFFEMKNFESAYYLLDSCKHFIKQNKLEDRQHFDVFLKFYEKLLNIKEKNETYEVRNFKSQLISHSYFLQKDWILEKVEEMEKSS